MAQLVKLKFGPDNGITDLGAQLAAANAGGDSFNIQGNELLIIFNAGVGACTVTLVSVADNFGIVSTANDITLVVGIANKFGIFGPFSPARFRDVNGNAQITYSTVTSLSVGVFGLAVRST